MTASYLSKLLGISRRSLFLYRKNFPDRAPKSFDNFREWQQFVALVKVCYSERNMQIGPLQEGWDQEYSPAAERKERIVKLQLGNAIREEEVKIFRRNTIPMQEVIETMEVITATVSAELLRIPGEAAQTLGGKGAPEIQTRLEDVIRDALERLSLAEAFLNAGAEPA